MKATYTLECTFNSSLEYAYRTPLHGDATRILKGYGPIPACIAFEDDQTWGKEGGTRVPILSSNWLVKGGRTGLDKILVRKDNEYWKWQVTDFNSWTLFFAKKAEGEWWILDGTEGNVKIRWRYTYRATSVLTQPFNWLFVKLLWRVVMKRGVIYMKDMAENEEPFLYD